MGESPVETSAEFVGLILSLANSAMIAMGKVPDPITGKAGVDLGQAEETIELLRVLRDKARGNLSREEEQLLESSLTNLRLTYVETMRRNRGSDANAPSGATDTTGPH